MWILPLVGYTGIVLGFAFLTLAIASGLYYLSELVEEHTVFSKRLLTQLIYAVVALQLLLALVDGFPLWLSAFTMASHAVYAGNLRRFPVVKLTEPVFLLSCVLVIANHFLWFRHFSLPPSMPPRPYSTSDPRHTDLHLPTFTQVASYFGICVWLVPFALFISLSASDYVLPSMGSEYATGSGSGAGVGAGSASSGGGGLNGGLGSAGAGSAGKKKGLAKAMVDGVREWVGESGEVMGFWRGEKTRRF